MSECEGGGDGSGCAMAFALVLVLGLGFSGIDPLRERCDKLEREVARLKEHAGIVGDPPPKPIAEPPLPAHGCTLPTHENCIEVYSGNR